MTFRNMAAFRLAHSSDYDSTKNEVDTSNYRSLDLSLESIPITLHLLPWELPGMISSGFVRRLTCDCASAFEFTYNRVQNVDGNDGPVVITASQCLLFNAQSRALAYTHSLQYIYSRGQWSQRASPISKGARGITCDAGIGEPNLWLLPDIYINMSWGN